MVKINKFLSPLLVVMVLALLLAGIAPIAHAASERQTASDEVTEVDFSEEGQKLKLTEGKNYILSYPVNGEGWQVSEVKYSIKPNVWKLFDEDTKNDYIVVEKCPESESGKVQLIVKCKSAKLIGLRVTLENEITGEKKDYAFTLSIVPPKPEAEQQFVFVQPSIPSDDKEEVPPIVIDTTGWSFDSITTVYDGTEYIVEVTGLPDYVTPVYTNNSRTDAGTSTAHVSFLVPEGYVTPEDMETTITIEKAPLYVITDKNLVETDDGKLRFLIPDGALPKGVNYTYTVNNTLADSDYAITHTGMYLINTDFELTDDFSEEMRKNYITDPSSAIYNVLEHEDITPSAYGLNFVLNLTQEKLPEESNEVRVTVSIKFSDPMGRNSVLTYVPVYDSSVLKYEGSILPDNMGGGRINAQGIVPAYTNSFGLLNDGPLTTFVFSINEGADASNLPFTVTEVSGVWIGPDPSVIDKSTSYTSAIVLNTGSDAVQYTVRLPYPSGWQPISLLSDDIEVQTASETAGDLSEDDSVAEELEVLSEEENVTSEATGASFEVELLASEETASLMSADLITFEGIASPSEEGALEDLAE